MSKLVVPNNKLVTARDENKKVVPHTYARFTMIKGEMGGGKTNTLTGLIIDRALETIKAIKDPDTGMVYPVAPARLVDPERFGAYDVVIAGKDGEQAIIQIPRSFIIIPDVRIFTNYHLFGVQYIYCGIRDMLEWIQSGFMRDGILGIDEAYIEGEARRGSSILNVFMTQFMQQTRKRHLELYLLVQHGRYIDWRFKAAATRQFMCGFDEKKKRVKLTVRDMRKNRKRTTSYWAPQYWRYYDTDEIPEMPAKLIEKAINKVA